MRSRLALGCVAQLAVPRNATARRKTRAMLARNLRPDRQPPHPPPLAVVVVDREVLCAAVVPDRERARRPAHAAGELGPRLVLLQRIDERAALDLGHVLQANGVAA